MSDLKLSSKCDSTVTKSKQSHNGSILLPSFTHYFPLEINLDRIALPIRNWLSVQIPFSPLINRDDVIVHSTLLKHCLLDTRLILQQKLMQHIIVSPMRAFTGTGCFDAYNKILLLVDYDHLIGACDITM